jgi:predicted glycosyltransferase involved in capsule biosynthesis
MEILMENFNNCCFIVPFKYNWDEDRIFNLKCVLSYLNSVMITNIVIVEQHENIKNNFCSESINKINYSNLNIIWIDYINNNSCFHKTKLYNIGMKSIKPNVEIIIPYDADVLIPLNQMIIAKDFIEKHQIDYCFPFSGNYVEIAKIISSSREKLLKTYNFDEYKKYAKEYTDILYSQCVRNGPPGLLRNCPPGGCIFIKKQVYIEMGLENEDFCGYGPEDVERKNRLIKLNYSTATVNGDLFHIEHTNTNRRSSNKNNYTLFSMLENMTKEQIINYYKQKNYRELYEIT